MLKLINEKKRRKYRLAKNLPPLFKYKRIGFQCSWGKLLILIFYEKSIFCVWNNIPYPGHKQGGNLTN